MSSRMPRMGLNVDLTDLVSFGQYRVGVYCRRCMRAHGVDTLLAILTTSAVTHNPGEAWGWGRVTRSRRKDGTSPRIVFKQAEDPDMTTGEVPIECQRCGFRSRVRLDRLARKADEALARRKTDISI